MAAGIASGLTLAGLSVVGVAHSAAEGLATILATGPDAAVIDLDLGLGPTGLDIAREVRARLPRAGITLLTGYAHPRVAGDSANLPSFVRYARKSQVSGMRELSRIVTASIDDAREERAVELPGLPAGMSEVQLDVLRLLAAGLSNAQIARVRVVTERAVEHVVRRLARQLDVTAVSEVNVRVALARRYFELTGATDA